MPSRCLNYFVKYTLLRTIQHGWRYNLHSARLRLLVDCGNECSNMKTLGLISFLVLNV